MTFKDIQRVNEGIKTTDIKGKAYAEVNQRIKAFRQLYPDGFIKTELVSIESGICIMRATVGYCTENGDRRTLATGTAYEKEDSSFINKTSYIENCETSAVGRAIGMLGIGIDTSVASYEEVANAINNQVKASESQIKCVEKYVRDIPALLDYYHIDKLEDLTVSQASEIIKRKSKEG